MRFMYIASDPAIAAYAEAAGVERIFVDMEVLGKAERQGRTDTHKAAHTYDDVAAVRAAVSRAELMVRVNPLHGGSAEELARLIPLGVDRVMLPMFSNAEEVARFSALLDGRLPVTWLAETPGALVRLKEWLPLIGEEDQVHFGLNDLSLAMGLDFLFEPMAAQLFDPAAALLRDHGIAFGIGGIARLGRGELPADCVMGEHVRLGCGYLILSRAFRGGAENLQGIKESIDLSAELQQLRDVETEWQNGDASALAENHKQLTKRVFEIADSIRKL
jgi:hypothetical protein